MVEISRHCKHPDAVNHPAKARKVFDIELAALKKVRAQIDVSFGRAVEVIIEAIQHLGKHCNFVKILGSYPNAD